MSFAGFLPGLLAAVFLCVPIAVLAGGEIEEVVVLGSYLEDGSFPTETQISADRERLEVIMPAEPEQLLQRLPGVSVYRPGGPGGVSEVFLRGAESNFTAVFVDGVRLTNPANTRGGSFDFSGLAINDVERVDIAMGAMSAIYGSDAMAGVIRIETAWPEAGRQSAYLEAGTESDWRAGAAAAFGLGDAVVLGLRASGVDGGEAVAGSELELTNLSARLAGRRSTGDHWHFDLRRVDRSRRSFPEVSGGPQLAVLPELEIGEGEELSLSAMTEWTLTPKWQAELVVSWVELDDDTGTPAVPPGLLAAQPAFTSDSEYRRGQLLWINRLTASERSRLAFGFDLVDEQGRDDGMVDMGFAVLPNAYRLERTTASAFVEVDTEWVAGFETMLALRLDHSDDASRTSGKLGLAKSFDRQNGRLWARLADGFKLPSFFALGNPLFGNPDLAPEKVTSIELGYDQLFGDDIEAGLSLFASEYEDLVDFDFENFINVNRGEVDITGAFVWVQMELGPTLSLGADATLSDISSAGDPLRRRPEKTGGVNLTWRPAAAWSVDVAARYVGERLITSIPTGDVVDGDYVSVDATARFRYSDSLALWVAIDNAFDTDYQDAPGFPAPGARARLGAELRF
ncbi:MAG: TonB-dependent receptor [Xanthomonadales bacterium]|nr:TonB-dependent receptor [Xanthomonadales bacterium]